jgi:hypothetical protein
MATMADRVVQLEALLQQTSMDSAPIQDQFVVERPPETELSTYPAFHQALPGFQRVFNGTSSETSFRKERRRFLGD